MTTRDLLRSISPCEITRLPDRRLPETKTGYISEIGKFFRKIIIITTTTTTIIMITIILIIIIIINARFFRHLHYFSSSAKLEIYRELWKTERLRDKATERGRQIAEFRQPLQEGTCPVRCLRQLRALGKTDRNPESICTRNVFNIGYYVHCSCDDTLSMYRFFHDKLHRLIRKRIEKSSAQYTVHNLANIYSWIQISCEMTGKNSITLCTATCARNRSRLTIIVI